MTTLSIRKAVPIAAFGMAATFAAGYAFAAQVHMQNALRDLQNGKAELAAALPDKGGHRVAAMKLVDQAIAETKAGIIAGM